MKEARSAEPTYAREIARRSAEPTYTTECMKISRADLWMRIKEDQQSRPEPQVQLAIPLDQVTSCNGPIEPYIALNSPLKEQIKTLNVACSNLKGRLY